MSNPAKGFPQSVHMPKSKPSSNGLPASLDILKWHYEWLWISYHQLPAMLGLRSHKQKPAMVARFLWVVYSLIILNTNEIRTCWLAPQNTIVRPLPIVYRKTQNNPYFLHKHELISGRYIMWVSHKKTKSDFFWKWDQVSIVYC